LHAAPAAIRHALRIVTRQAYARIHVHLEEAAPFLVGDIEEGLRLEDAEVVDEDVVAGHGLDKGGSALGRTEVGGDAGEPGIRHGLLDLRDGGIDARLGAAGDDDAGARAGQALGDGEADAGGGTGDDGTTLGKVNLHG